MAWKKPDPEFIKVPLPPFVAQRSQDFPSWLLVSCPREDCMQTFLIRRKEWYESRPEKTRACPYCFKAASLPRPRDIRRAAR